MLGKASKLAATILANIDHLLDLCRLKESEKLLGAFPGKTDGAEKDVHGG